MVKNLFNVHSKPVSSKFILAKRGRLCLRNFLCYLINFLLFLVRHPNLAIISFDVWGKRGIISMELPHGMFPITTGRNLHLCPFSFFPSLFFSFWLSRPLVRFPNLSFISLDVLGRGKTIEIPNGNFPIAAGRHQHHRVISFSFFPHSFSLFCVSCSFDDWLSLTVSICCSLSFLLIHLSLKHPYNIDTSLNIRKIWVLNFLINMTIHMFYISCEHKPTQP